MSCVPAMAKPVPEGHRRYMLVLAQSHVHFRLPELFSLAQLYDLSIVCDQTTHDPEEPFFVVDIPNDEEGKLVQIVDRMILIKSAGSDAAEETTFKVDLTTFGRKSGRKRQTELFKRLTAVPMRGKVDLKNPQVTMVVSEDFGSDHNDPPEEPCQVFIGRLVARSKRGEAIRAYDLKVRNMIGNTSMDPELSLIMANMGLARPGSLVLDPFVGTATVMGTDISFQVIHGVGKTSRSKTGSKIRGPKENIHATFEQYGHSPLLADVFVADTSVPSFRSAPLFDAIVTDPPYGIREGARKIGFSGGPESTAPPVIADEHREGHFPRSEQYGLGSVFRDLVTFAAQFLVVGGRLVFWMPCVTSKELQVPQHSCLEQLACSQQVLSHKLSRWLVTMVKVREYDADAEERAGGGPEAGWEVRSTYLSRIPWQGKTAAAEL